MKLKTKIFIQELSKLVLIALAVPLTLICIFFGAYYQDTSTVIIGFVGNLAVMLAADYLAS